MTEYVELHCHSAFSFLDGASSPDELAGAAVEQGYGAMALTDHDTVSGSMEFAMAAKPLGLKAIHGAEITLDDGRHITLLVENRDGWRNLCHILTRAHAFTRDDRGLPGQPECPLQYVLDRNEGLVCLNGCADHGVHDQPTMQRLLEAFGPDRLRVEIQRPFQRHDRALARRLEMLADRLGLECVATGNVHAHAIERARLQDAFVALRHGLTLDSSEPVRRGNRMHVLAPPAEMAARFAEYPSAVAAASDLADRLDFDLTTDLGYRYPGAEDPNSHSDLAGFCHSRFEELYPAGNPHRKAASARLDEELALINHLNLSGFFVLHHDLLDLAREVAAEIRGPDSARSLLPPGRGRGSSVSSIVCYLTGLSHIDPIKNDLLLGRFLHEDITGLPDIDIDFPRDIRARLLPRIHEKYGNEHSAIVAAFPTFRTRGAVRELGKVLGLPPGEIERVARGAERWSKQVDDNIAEGLGRSSAGRWDHLAELVAAARGLPRHLSQHSGGVIISTEPLIDCCPVLPAAMDGRQLCQWDKDSCADAGFLKIDVLGLGMLSAVERCVETIAETRGERIDLSRIPFDDIQTYTAIQTAETMGVFQIESRAQMSSLVRTLPASLDDLTIQVAIVRPGPIQGGAVNPYIDRLQKLREDPNYEIPYPHPSLEPALRDTLGTIIFQDQVLEVSMAFAGFTPGQAEGLRRAMSRKRSAEALDAYRSSFIAGAVEMHGVGEEEAAKVFEMISGFSGFGFPKAHGAAFGLLAYQSTWLRVHYGPEFLCALLNEQEMGFYAPDTLVHEAQRRGIEILPPDVNASRAECSVEQDESEGGRGVRIGLGYISGVGTREAEALVAERDRGGPFTGLGDLASRAGAGHAILDKLAWSGACDGLAAGGRREALWELGVVTPGEPVGDGNTQLSLAVDPPVAPDLREMRPWEEMVADYATTAMTLANHPIHLLRPSLGEGMASSADLARIPHGTPVTVAGMVIARQRPGTARGVVFLLFEDEFGTVNLICPPEIYKRHRLEIRTEPLLSAHGRMERHARGGGQINILVDRIDVLDPPDFRPVAPAVMSFAEGRRR